jgi:hypothetical protein
MVSTTTTAATMITIVISKPPDLQNYLEEASDLCLGDKAFWPSRPNEAPLP